MTTKLREWALFEDNSGGLHLFLFSDRKAIYTSDYSHMPERLVEDVQAYMDGADPTDWDGNEDPQDLYAGFCDTEHGVKLVAQGNAAGTEFFWECMGAAALSALSRQVYWHDPATGGEILLLDTSHPDLHTAGDATRTDNELFEVAEDYARDLDLTPARLRIDGPLGTWTARRYPYHG